ncbi:hypothetical protein [Streptomyces sp. NPDC048659]|uniref:hypothetical protein n=1 Tax=Streptomyces sp. NPDC048659 TaxID=3155489 RepID=UPI00341A78AF
MLAHAVAGNSSSGISVYAVAFYILFGVVGVCLALNFQSAADRFFRIVSVVMGGKVGWGTPWILRLVGAMAAVMAIIGICVEVVVELT